jgi:hypothetical protein
MFSRSPEASPFGGCRFLDSWKGRLYIGYKDTAA